MKYVPKLLTSDYRLILIDIVRKLKISKNSWINFTIVNQNEEES